MSIPGLHVWDPWPVELPNRSIATTACGELWVALVAPDVVAPEDRHDHARQHLLLVNDSVTDLGPLLPSIGPGTREWSGSTVFDPITRVLTAYYTAAGDGKDPASGMRQRVMVVEATASLQDCLQTRTWGERREAVLPRPPYFESGVTRGDRVATAFRDPGWFRDPEGTEHLLIAASIDDPQGGGPWGCIALASKHRGVWQLGEPLIAAVGTNRELERPHIIARDGLFYLFVSTQRHMFVGTDQTTGLYGYVSNSLSGPYTPLNGDGLVVSNPLDRPHEAYAWLVLEDLSVVCFLNYPDEGPKRAQPGLGARFAGGFGPVWKLELDGAVAVAVRQREAESV